jgi:hypothetical protein
MVLAQRDLWFESSIGNAEVMPYRRAFADGVGQWKCPTANVNFHHSAKRVTHIVMAVSMRYFGESGSPVAESVRRNNETLEMFD